MTTRCKACRSKVGLVGFECKCGHTYCTSHRFPDTHDCQFDHKTEDRKHLTLENQKIVAQKVAAI